MMRPSAAYQCIDLEIADGIDANAPVDHCGGQLLGVDWLAKSMPVLLRLRYSARNDAKGSPS